MYGCTSLNSMETFITYCYNFYKPCTVLNIEDLQNASLLKLQIKVQIQDFGAAHEKSEVTLDLMSPVTFMKQWQNKA